MKSVGKTIQEILAEREKKNFLTPELIESLNEDEEYIKDGDIWCKKCNTRRTTLTFRAKGRCLCRCQSDEIQRERDKLFENDKRRFIESLRRASLLGEQYDSATFAETDLYSEEFRQVYARCQKYCEAAPLVLRKGHGIYLYGNPGTGKTHITACMANELLTQGRAVLFTSMGEISKAIRGTFDKKGGETEQSFMKRLNSVDFLFIDDFGTERLVKGNEDMWLQEKVFDIVNTRYNNNKPIIFTSNYSLAQMARERGLSLKTVDRIQEKNVTMELKGSSYRDKARELTEFDF